MLKTCSFDWCQNWVILPLIEILKWPKYCQKCKYSKYYQPQNSFKYEDIFIKNVLNSMNCGITCKFFENFSCSINWAFAAFGTVFSWFHHTLNVFNWLNGSNKCITINQMLFNTIFNINLCVNRKQVGYSQLWNNFPSLMFHITLYTYYFIVMWTSYGKLARPTPKCYKPIFMWTISP